ncbi:hypothetical protein ACR2V4_27020, partial [Klebsiella pneumoniae]
IVTTLQREKVLFTAVKSFLHRKIESTFRSSVQFPNSPPVFESKNMSRSFSNAKLLSALVGDKISMALSRRAYAAASGSGRGSVAARAGVMAKKGGEESGKTSWVPDPVTGYYRPENRANEIDVAELREMLLKNNIRRH